MVGRYIVQTRYPLLVLTTLLLFLAGVACTGATESPAAPAPTELPEATEEPTLIPSPSDTPMAQAVSLEGPSCPEGFQEQQVVTRHVKIAANATLTLTLGSTPSVPCGWQGLDVEDQTVLQQVDHQTEWPAEGVTPMPGAPGVELWVVEALKEGESALSLACQCLGEQGAEQELEGTFVLNVTVLARQ